MNIFDIILNIFEVLPKDIANINQSTLIQAPLITTVFYFLSRWFRAYILRLGIFVFGGLVLLNIFQGQSFLFRFDFYAGLGILLPHIEIVELTYLILREKLLFSYGKTQELIFILSKPFVWLYAKSNYFKEFYKAKQRNETYGQNYKHQEQRQHKEEKPLKQEEEKTYEWWESPNDYERLHLQNGASKSDIEKAKKRLQKLYHPDLVFKDEEKRKKHTIIFQNVSNAYDDIMKKLS